MVDTIPFYFGSHFGKQWWKQQAKGWEGSMIIEEGNTMMAAVDDIFLVDYYESLMIAPCPLPLTAIEGAP